MNKKKLLKALFAYTIAHCSIDENEKKVSDAEIYKKVLKVAIKYPKETMLIAELAPKQEYAIRDSFVGMLNILEVINLITNYNEAEIEMFKKDQEKRLAEMPKNDFQKVINELKINNN